MLILLIVQVMPNVFADSNITGIVFDDEGVPLREAQVSSLNGLLIGKTVYTDEGGKFTIQVEESIKQIIILYDNKSTLGWDFIPTIISINELNVKEISIKLIPACSIVPEGDIQFVETENLPTSTTYYVVDEKNSIITLSGFTLLYTKKTSYSNPINVFSQNEIIMPLNYSKIMASSSIIIGNMLANKIFFMDIEGKLIQGEKRLISVTKESVKYNIKFVDEFLENLKINLNNMEKLGFYLAKEKRDILTASTQIEEAKISIKENIFDSSFDVLKKGFIQIRQVSSTLETLRLDAISSVYIILGFLALSAVVAGFLLAENKTISFILNAIFFSIASYVIYVVYPGSLIIPPMNYLLTAAVSIIVFTLLANIIPKLIGYTTNEDNVRMSKVLIPIFSIAKRTLRRRRTRFFFTLLSITLLVMSFVTLTSLSEEYGIISSLNFRGAAPETGVIIRSGSWSDKNPDFMLLSDVELAWLQKLQSINTVSIKYSSQLPRRQITTVAKDMQRVPIMGIIAINSTLESKIINFEQVLIEGNLPKSGEIAIPLSMKEALSAKINDNITIFSTTLRISGILEDTEFSRLQEFDGRDYLPDKLVNVSPPGEAPAYEQYTCEPSEVVILDSNTLTKTVGVGIIRVALGIKQGIDVEILAEKLALERGYQAWSASPNGSTLYRLGSYIEGKGLPLIIPWAIVVLNVIVTMLNSLFERRREISMLSSVGLNPAQIASIFVAEASITGFIAGGIGYLLGLSLYRIMPILGASLEVHQKISAMWSLASIGIAISAVLVGAFAALRNSIVITPSLTRKWKISNQPNTNEPFEIPIPVKFERQLLNDFTDYLVQNLKNKENDPVMRTSSIKLAIDGEKRIITFAYKSTVLNTGNFFTKNTIYIEPNGSGEYNVKLFSIADSVWAHETGSMIRQLIMAWSDRPKKQ